MDLKFKNSKKENLTHKRSLFQGPKRLSELGKVPYPGNETTRLVENKSKPIIKKSVSHYSIDFNNILQKNSKFSKDTVKTSLYDSKFLKKSATATNRLPPVPMIFSQVPTKFYLNLCKIEAKLTDFYIEISE